MSITKLCASLILAAVGLSLYPSVLAAQQAHQYKTPLSYQVNFGGLTPAQSSGGYSSSVLVGAGVSIPIRRWLSLDVANLDFGFGTTDQTQTISVSDGSTRSTKNYQMMFSSGGRVNIPLGRTFALGLGGGFGALAQNEYVPSSFSTVGTVQTITNVTCTTCSRNTLQGEYVEGRFFGRSDRFTGLGVSAKYYMLGPAGALPGQKWLTVGISINFGI